MGVRGVNLNCEVVIVGAGPAGASLALELARRGRDVLIVERAAFPREKPCGDCVNPGALRELERLGVRDRLEAALKPALLCGWRVEAPDGRAFQTDFGSDGEGVTIHGWGVRRRDLDAALLDEACRAGARVSFGLRAYDVLREAGRVVGVRVRDGTRSFEIRARFIVAADGLRSVIRRRLQLGARASRLRKIALVGHLAGVDGLGDPDRALYGELRVQNGRCCGFAPLAVGANLTLVVPGRDAGEIASGAREFMRAALADFPEVDARLKRGAWDGPVLVTGPFDQPVRRPVAPGVVLVGDAAGYYDPFTGEGIYQALRSAALAAPAIEAALRDPLGEPEALREYGARMGQEFGARRALQRLIEAVISRRRAMSTLVAALGVADVAARRLLRVTGDLAHPLTLLAPAAWARALMDGLARADDHA